MMRRKKSHSGLFSEVDDIRQMVYDFRRRTQYLFENYRAVGYKKHHDYDLNQLMDEDEKILGDLVAAHAVDDGNTDCLVGRVLGPVRDGFVYLDDQSLEHLDFYSRQGSNMKTHCKDIERILEFWKKKEASMEKEHENTVSLWNKYCGYTRKGEYT